MRKKLPIGIENFEEFLSENFYYVDKTLFIKELLQNWGKVNQFTRPRRFGKSLNMSMLKSFFEIGSKPAEYSCAGVPLFRRNGYRQSGGREPLFRNRDTALNDCCLRVYWLKAGSNPYTSRMDL